MLTVSVDSPALPAGHAAEPKWDGFRAQLAVHSGGRVLLRSRQGTDMTGSFPEIRAAALTQLPADVGLDGELVVWESGRLVFERLQQRLARRGKGASEAAGRWPAHYVTGVRAGSWGDSECDQSRLSRPETCVRHVPP